MQGGEVRRPVRHDTYDLRYDLRTDDSQQRGNMDSDHEEHSVLESDSDEEMHEEEEEDFIDDDGSSDLSIPNESIDFDLVYSLHSFAATVEGQANVVKGDSLFLMDDSNSYWWLVRVLKTQEVGYIPAENIETPFERLARLNKHRNVDLASATQAERQGSLQAAQERFRNNSRQGNTPSPGDRGFSSQNRKSVNFGKRLQFHRYPPAVWREEEEEEEDIEWDLEGYGDDELLDEGEERGVNNMEYEDGMSWEDGGLEEVRDPALAPTDRAPVPVQVPVSLQPAVGIAQQRQQAQQQQQQAMLADQQQEPRERLISPPPPQQQNAISQQFDPTGASNEPRRITVTPSIAQDENDGGNSMSAVAAVLQQQQQEEERMKRLREEGSDESLRKRAKANKDPKMAPVSSAQLQKSNSGKLRKDRDQPQSGDESKEKKKGSGILGGLFGRKKDKGKEKGSVSLSDSESMSIRTSEDSNRSRPSAVDSVISPTTNAAMQQQQHIRNTSDPRRSGGQQQAQAPAQAQSMSQPQRQPQQDSPPMSLHASQLRQRDQQQQALYQRYLDNSPSSPPEARPSLGLWSAQSVMNTGVGGGGLGPPTNRPRPGSLILSPTGEGPMPELSVIRVFAGDNLQTDATFKTVLLNPSTTSTELVRQAIQRFRLPAGENESDYFLTVKQLEGSSAVLRMEENPLQVFENLVQEAMELPKVKRSSMGSITSVSSNLSMHPAISKLPMNDFTDDSAVKLYLNRRGENNEQDILVHEADETLIAEDDDTPTSPRGRFLGVASTSGNNVSPERFSSPSFRFALQLVIYPDDLPDNMVFDSLTEAIVFKDTIRKERDSIASGISMSLRRKVFVFPKNVTVAEVIELGLERFGILEGVVDGGDEVEDKLTKRRSMARVRYTLAVDNGMGDPERELSPASKVIEAYPKPPTYRVVDTKRRSIDSTQLLGASDDVNPDDPMFVLRRATSYRMSSSRRRSAPLDELALANMHRDSHASTGSNDAYSKQAVIEAQRRARRDNQQAILSAQANNARGVDVLLPGNAMLRSTRSDNGDFMRYSYVEPEGDTYDVSDIVEEEWTSQNDMLEGALAKNTRDNVGAAIDRVLSKIKSGNRLTTLTTQTVDSKRSSSQYSADDDTVEAADLSASSASPQRGLNGGYSAPPAIPERSPSRPGTVTPTNGKPPNRRQPSIASVLSDMSGYETAPSQPPMSRAATSSPRTARAASPRSATTTPTPKSPQVPASKYFSFPDDDFGVDRMLTIIRHRSYKPSVPLPKLDPVDEMLFGRPVDMDSLHPKIRDVYAPGFQRLEDIDKMLDNYLLGLQSSS